MIVPFLDLQAQYRQLKPEIDAAVQGVVSSGRYVLGPNVAALERDLAELCGCRFGIGVASGTDALVLALRALTPREPGGEVITTPFSYVATAAAIVRAGHVPVFVDIDPETFNMDPGLVEEVINPRTVAVLPVHLYGQPAEIGRLPELGEHVGIPVIEDAAQAIGAAYLGQPIGCLSDAAVLSFYPTKNLGAMGDGGMVVTDDPVVADRVRFLARQGERKRYFCEEVGLNSRLDELQAAILRAKLPYLWEWTLRRRVIAAQYDAAFGDLPLQTPAVIEDALHVYHQYTIRVSWQARDQLRAYLEEQGIGTGVYYPEPLHLQPAFCGYGPGKGELPHAERASAEVLSLPVYPEMSPEQVGAVVHAVRRFFSE